MGNEKYHLVGDHWCSLTLTLCSVPSQLVTAAAVLLPFQGHRIPQPRRERKSKANKQGAQLKTSPSVQCFVTNTNVIAVMLLT